MGRVKVRFFCGPAKSKESPRLAARDKIVNGIWAQPRAAGRPRSAQSSTGDRFQVNAYGFGGIQRPCVSRIMSV